MKVLICSDGHKQAEKAIRYLATTAAACGAEATLLGIVEHPSDEAALQEALRHQAQILRDKKVAVEFVTKAGNPLEEIQKRTREQAFDLVLIGAERKTGGPFVMSAKAYHIIKSVEPPVLVFIGERTGLQRVLICSGGQETINRAVKLTGELACKTRLSVTVLHVLPEPPAIYSEMIEREDNAAELLNTNSTLGRNLRAEKEALEKFGLDAQIKLRHGLVVPEILEEVTQGDYDLVVTGSTLAGGSLRTYIMGDITSEVVNRAVVPVLVVRGPAIPRGFFSTIFQLFSRSGKRA